MAAPEDERPRDPAVVVLPKTDRAAVFERVPVSGGAVRRSRFAARLGPGSELEASADVHHRSAPRVERADDLLDIDPLEVHAGRRDYECPS